MFADDLGIDVWEAIDAAVHQAVRLHALHARAGRRRPLPADRPVVPVVAGARSSLGRTFRFVELANDVNDHMPDYVVRRLDRARSTSAGWPSTGRRILLLGLAYKRTPATPASRRPADLPPRLVALGADVRAADPHVDDRDVPAGTTLVEATAEEAAAADVVVVLVDHDDFDLPALLDDAATVFDTRHCVPARDGVEHL